MDIANLQIRVDSQGANTATQSLGKLEAQSIKTETATKRVTATTSNADAAYRRAAVQIQRVEVEQQKLANQQQRLSQQSDKLTGSVGNLANAYKGLIAGFAVSFIAKAADDMTIYESRIKLATTSTMEADKALAGLIQTGKDTGSLASAIEIFSRISLVRSEINATNEEMLTFTDTVQKLGIVSGASGENLKSGLMQLGQSLSSDVVRAEEFNSIMENIPAVGKSIADEFGISTGKLRALVIEGEVLSKDVFAAILNATEKTNAQFDTMEKTGGRALAELGIRMMEIVGSLNEAVNGTQIFVAGIDIAGDAISALSNVIKGWIDVFKGLFTVVVGGVLEAITAAINAVQSLLNVGVKGINLFRTDKIQEFDVLGGLTSVGIRNATQEDAQSKFRGAGQNFLGAADDTLGVFGLANKDFKQIDKKESTGRIIEKDYKAAAEALKGLSDEEKAATKAAEQHQKQIAKTIEDLKFRNQQMGRSIEDQELYNQLRQANVEIDSIAGEQIRILVEEQQALQKEQESLNKVIGVGEDAFEKLWKGAISGATDWRDIMGSVLSDVTDLFYDFAIKDNISNLLGSVFGKGGGGKSSSGGGIGSIISSFAGSLFGGGGKGIGSSSNGLAGLFGFADGGSFKVGGNGGTDSQLVAFRASPDETVTVSRPEQRGGGSSGMYVTIDARGAANGVEEKIMAAIGMLDKSIERRALNATENQMKRNPKFGR